MVDAAETSKFAQVMEVLDDSSEQMCNAEVQQSDPADQRLAADAEALGEQAEIGSSDSGELPPVIYHAATTRGKDSSSSAEHSQEVNAFLDSKTENAIEHGSADKAGIAVASDTREAQEDGQECREQKEEDSVYCVFNELENSIDSGYGLEHSHSDHAALSTAIDTDTLERGRDLVLETRHPSEHGFPLAQFDVDPDQLEENYRSMQQAHVSTSVEVSEETGTKDDQELLDTEKDVEVEEAEVEVEVAETTENVSEERLDQNDGDTVESAGQNNDSMCAQEVMSCDAGDLACEDAAIAAAESASTHAGDDENVLPKREETSKGSERSSKGKGTGGSKMGQKGYSMQRSGIEEKKEVSRRVWRAGPLALGVAKNGSRPRSADTEGVSASAKPGPAVDRFFIGDPSPQTWFKRAQRPTNSTKSPGHQEKTDSGAERRPKKSPDSSAVNRSPSRGKLGFRHVGEDRPEVKAVTLDSSPPLPASTSRLRRSRSGPGRNRSTPSAAFEDEEPRVWKARTDKGSKQQAHKLEACSKPKERRAVSLERLPELAWSPRADFFHAKRDPHVSHERSRVWLGSTEGDKSQRLKSRGEGRGTGKVRLRSNSARATPRPAG